MLPYILYEISLFSPGDERKEAEKDLSWFLEALTQRNQDYLRQNPGTPKLYKSGVVYERPLQFQGEPTESRVLREALGIKAKEPKVAEALSAIQMVFGGERFCDIGVILRRGSIDCDGLACWRVAELRQAGIHAVPYMSSRKRPDGGTTYHALVLWPDGTSEDPSLLLGMGGPDRAADRAQQISWNQERCDRLRSDPAYRARLRQPPVRNTGPYFGPTSTTVDTGDADAAIADALSMVGYADLDDDLLPPDDYDSRILAHTGLMRGGW